MTKQKAYVQFSKQIVLLVTVAVTVISLLAVVLCFFRSDTDALIIALLTKAVTRLQQVYNRHRR